MVRERLTQRVVCLSLALVTACAAETPTPADVILDSEDVSPAEDATTDLDTSPSVDTSDAGDAGTSDTTSGPTKRPNILLIIVDDFGLDASPCHDVAPQSPKAPHLAKLCAEGVVFDHAWSAPTCSPTRAAILTGRHGFRNGVGSQLTSKSEPGLSLTEWTLPMALQAALPDIYASACVGKWHLGGSNNGLLQSPNKLGFPHYVGHIHGALQSYFSWTRVVNGVKGTCDVWAPSQNVDDALAWLSSEQRGARPFFLWLAFNAPHAPFHVPPAKLHSAEGLAVEPPKNPIAHYHAMIEALDTELGRLFQGIGSDEMANTYVIFVGDNGTPNAVVQAPVQKDMAKGTLYEGGVRVPLVITGPAIATPGRAQGLVHVLDLFATVLELAGASTKQVQPKNAVIDSVSLVPYLKAPASKSLRSHVMSELFGSTTSPNGKTIRDAEYKLVRYEEGGEELFRLSDDPWETKDLWAKPAQRTPEIAARHQALVEALDALLASQRKQP